MGGQETSLWYYCRYMTLPQLLVAFQPQDISSLEFASNGDILRVTFLNTRQPATSQDSVGKPPEEGKPAKLRQSSPESLINPLPLHCID